MTCTCAQKWLYCPEHFPRPKRIKPESGSWATDEHRQVSHYVSDFYGRPLCSPGAVFKWCNGDAPKKCEQCLELVMTPYDKVSAA